MATLLTERQRGSLPSNSEVNPRRESKEHVKPITLRSGRELAVQGKPPVVREVETEEVDQVRPKDHMQGEHPQEKKSIERLDERKETEKHAGTDEPTTSVPYPQRLKKNKLDKKFTKSMEVFKKLHIKIPFASALDPMPSYVKFMKDILLRKIRLSDFETMNLTEECSVILHRKLPHKLKDLGSFTIPCKIGNSIFERALCELVLTSCLYLFLDG